MVKAFGREGAFLDDFALGVGDLQAWRDANPANLTAEKADLFAHRVIERELDAGRPGVDHRDGLRHGHLVVRNRVTSVGPAGTTRTSSPPAEVVAQAMRLAPPST